MSNQEEWQFPNYFSHSQGYCINMVTNHSDATPHPTNGSASSDVISLEVACTIAFLIFVAGLAGNSLICYGYLRYRQLRTQTNFFVLNLAVADLVLICVLISWIIQDILGNPNRKMVGRLLQNTEILCFSASMLNMAAVSVDRYIAVLRPLRYTTLVTRSRAQKTVLVIWLYSLMIAVVGFARYFIESISNDIFITALATISYVLPTMVIIFAHLNIFRVAWLKKKTSSDMPPDFDTRRKLLAPRIKLSINTLIILVPMTTAWGVFYGITLFEAHSEETLPLSPIVEFAVALSPYVTAAVDPIVYLLVTRDLRKVVQGMCMCYQSKKRKDLECITLPAFPRSLLHDRWELRNGLLDRESGRKQYHKDGRSPNN